LKKTKRMDNSVTEAINKQNMKYHEVMCKCSVYAEWCRCITNHNYNNRNMEKLISKVTVWADNKNLIKPENSLKQFTKVVEEVGEIAAALARNNKGELKDGIGDAVVTLVILAEQQGLSLEECLQAAWDEIKDRKGKTVNGAFIKEEDLA
jgi:NTP pyrophosphatase (non-canonical NTP hydrolase)